MVEDEFLIKLTLIETLMDAGFDVTSADTADEAAGISHRTHRFDILVTDIQTPGSLDGIELAKQMRSRQPTLPVLFMTGRPQSMARYGRLGPLEELVPKPYGPSDLLSAIGRLLSH